MEGVVRAPSEFSITFGVAPSMTATQELVVPRSMPMTLAILVPHVSRDREAPKRPGDGCGVDRRIPRNALSGPRCSVTFRRAGFPTRRSWPVYRRGPEGAQGADVTAGGAKTRVFRYRGPNRTPVPAPAIPARHGCAQ